MSQKRSIVCGLDLAKSEGKAYTFFQAERKSRFFRWICQSNESICGVLNIKIDSGSYQSAQPIDAYFTTLSSSFQGHFLLFFESSLLIL